MNLAKTTKSAAGERPTPSSTQKQVTAEMTGEQATSDDSPPPAR